MGDRANIRTSDGINFYTHWEGTELPEILARALERGKDRWDDYIYLNRIIFCEMVRRSIDDTTGFGISIALGDGANRVICLTEHGVVVGGKEISFQKYINNRPSWDDIYG